MEQRNENVARDERLDERIDQMLTGRHSLETPTTAEQVAHEFARLATEESPRMSNAARAQGLGALRAQASRKRAAQCPNWFGFLNAVPRWAQVGAVALVVVLVANGVTIAAADALPGSPLYVFKRVSEGGQLLLQNSNGQRAQLWMNLANTRLDELQRLLNNGAQVDPSALDAVDESILRALTELAGTRGEERVALLQSLTALSIRQQQILRQMALNASPADRVRLEQTERLLQGVANYAASPDAVVGPEISPLEFLTPTVTPTVTPSSTNTSTPQPTPTALPSLTREPALITENANDNSGNANVNDNDNVNGNDNANDNGNDADNGNDNAGVDNGNGNDNDNGNDNSDGNGNDDDDDNSGSGNGGDNSGNGNGNDNGDDNSGSGNGGDDNSGSGNGNDNNDDNSGSGNGGDANDDNDDDDDNSGKGNGDEDEDDDDNSGSGNGGQNDDDDDDNSGSGSGGGGGGGNGGNSGSGNGGGGNGGGGGGDDKDD